MGKTHSTNTKTLWWLVTILLFAFFVRVLYLDAQSLWADEAYTYIATQSDTFFQTIIGDVHPPCISCL
ncbi:MAG: hypothetical protein AAFV98_12855 [Chloroflexota bacterium]